MFTAKPPEWANRIFVVFTAGLIATLLWWSFGQPLINAAKTLVFVVGMVLAAHNITLVEAALYAIGTFIALGLLWALWKEYAEWRENRFRRLP